MSLFGLGKIKPRIELADRPSTERVSILLPVLNEAQRIEPCLISLIAQPEEVQEILVVDGGSNDGTQAIVERFHRLDQRVRLIDASPIDQRWTGKAWGLHNGLQRSAATSDWILCVDADVTVAPVLVRSLLNHENKNRVATFSVATSQRLSDDLAALLHPAMLATLIYRFGSPGKASTDHHRVQANGQCFFSRRATLLRWQAFRAAQSSLCEDITIARRLADCGEAVGFYEADSLVEVSMYKDWRETWDNWPRSLPMRDQYFGWREALGLLGILVIQALPLPVFIIAIIFTWPFWLLLLSGFLVAIRIGVLIGMTRAYPQRPWSYWLSPLADLPVVLRIIQFALRRRHQWRGRTYVRVKGGTFEPLGDARQR